MQIKDLLNEFEADWAAMPQVEKEKLAMLKNKSIVVSGHKLARCLCYALLYLNEAKDLNIKITLAGKSRECMSDYHSELLIRNDFEFIDFNSLPELKNADYVIFTGLCGEDNITDVSIFADETSAIKSISDVSARLCAKTVHLSDSRVYGIGKTHRVYSENEYADLDINSPDSLMVQLMRTAETLWKCCQKGNKFDLTILRTGIVLGASTNINTCLDSAFEAIAQKSNTQIIGSDKKYSFVYISDVFRAIIYSLTTIKSNTTYNVAGIDSTASMTTLGAVLHDIYSERSRIKINGIQELCACAINSSKISDEGCAPQIDLETALEICVMGKMQGEKAMSLPHSQEGRLSSIQEIMLAYLLEMDRICKKYKIKWFLGGGTLLGAVRHKGFIPWDDDADIMMLREDYDKFCKIAASELPPSMTLQTYENDKNCFYDFAKLRLNGTIFATGFAKNHKQMHNGIAFDIFCHDKTANSKLGQKLHLAITLFTRALVFNKWNNRKAENGSKLQSVMTNFFKRTLPLRFSLWLEIKTLKFFKNKKNAKYLYDGMGRNIYNGSFPIEYLDEVIYVDFEGYKLPVPKEYDKYLTFLYGDYMELAPLSTRMGCHIIERCDIGKYDGFKINSAK